MDDTTNTYKQNPSSSNRLIVTKVPIEVYSNSEAKSIFEQVFRTYDESSSFIYLPSFRRVLVTMSSPESALIARLETQGWRLPEAIVGHSNKTTEETGIRCYFSDDKETRQRRQRRRSHSSQNTTSFEDDHLTDEEGDYSDLRIASDEDDMVDDLDNFEHLAPPKPEKQFLLSPPASPPVGWEPRQEAEPLISYDLLHALAALEPG
ncbi:unnamed protein product [Hymenolepis diminuta]|nr:unnamed protein product [Hymenolepis diminuta]